MTTRLLFHTFRRVLPGLDGLDDRITAAARRGAARVRIYPDGAAEVVEEAAAPEPPGTPAGGIELLACYAAAVRTDGLELRIAGLRWGRPVVLAVRPADAVPTIPIV